MRRLRLIGRRVTLCSSALRVLWYMTCNFAMERTSRIHDAICAYHEGMAGPHHRYRSWEHCFRYFNERTVEELKEDKDEAALQLGFYLASWGMYRGSSFLLSYTYTVHVEAIDQLLAPRFSPLRKREFGGGEDWDLVPVIWDAIGAVREAYRPFAPLSATDTLVTKILLGTFGCLPACDQYFIKGFKADGFRYSSLNKRFIHRVLTFCQEHIEELREEQRNIEAACGLRYPLAKLVDMYFWQLGVAA